MTCDNEETPGQDEVKTVEEAQIRVVRVGHGANCSSIGSVIDTLFVTALAGGAIFAAIAAALASEPVRVAGTAPAREAPPGEPGSEGDKP
jgi:hypothetical protein